MAGYTPGKRSFELRLTTTVSELDFQDAIIRSDRDDALEAVLAIDLAIADIDFTEALIRRLAKSIRGDMSKEEFVDLFLSIAKEHV